MEGCVGSTGYPKCFILGLFAILVLFCNISSSKAWDSEESLRSTTECTRFEHSVIVNGSTFCKSCSSCNPGEGIRRHCSAHRDTLCVSCKAGRKFSMEINGQRKCMRCRHCHGHQTVKKECTPTTDTVCLGCKQGYYYDPVTMECRECSPCNKNLLSQGLIVRLEECSDNPTDRQCPLLDIEYTDDSDILYPEEESNHEDIHLSKTPSPNFNNESPINVETTEVNKSRESDENTLSESSLQQDHKFFYAGVACFCASAIFMTSSFIFCCHAMKKINEKRYQPHKRLPRNNTIYRQIVCPKTPVETSNGSLDTV